MLESPTVQKTGPDSYTASYGNDRSLYVEFYTEAVLNEFISSENGIPHFDDVDFISITTPGSKNTFRRRVKLEHDNGGEPPDNIRFPRQWEQFKSQKEQTTEGSPVTECPFFTKAYSLNLKAKKVHTLEQIRDIPDNNLEVLGLGGREIREKVRAFLEKAVDASSVTKLIAKIEALEADNRIMKEQLAARPKEDKKLKLAN